MNSADPLNECISCFQQLLLMNSMNAKLSASLLNNSLMTLLDTLLMLHESKLKCQFLGIIFCSISTLVRAEQSRHWTRRGPTHLASQCRYALCSAKLSSFPSAGACWILFMSNISYNSGEDNTFLLTDCVENTRLRFSWWSTVILPPWSTLTHRQGVY